MLTGCSGRGTGIAGRRRRAGVGARTVESLLAGKSTKTMPVMGHRAGAAGRYRQRLVRHQFRATQYKVSSSAHPQLHLCKITRNSALLHVPANSRQPLGRLSDQEVEQVRRWAHRMLA